MSTQHSLSRTRWLTLFATFLAETDQDIDLASATRIGERWYSGAGLLNPQAAATMCIAFNKRHAALLEDRVAAKVVARAKELTWT